MLKGHVVIVEQFQTAEFGPELVKKVITTWLTAQLNTPSTKDACAVLSAQAFKINSCQTAAHKV